MKISRANEADHDKLVEIWEASVRATHHFLTEEDLLYFKPLVSGYFGAVDLYVVRGDGDILGFLGTGDNEIQMLFLHPDARGKGIGKLLVRFAIDECLVTKVEVNEQNEQAVGFYQYMGFKVRNRLETDHLGKPYPLLLMELA